MKPGALVVGGGIAGAGVAAALAPDAAVTLVEQEAALAYHTTGRSAAVLFGNLGAGPIRPLTHASRPVLEDPSELSVDHPLLSPRGGLIVANSEEREALTALYEVGLATGAAMHPVDGDEARRICPALLPEAAETALWDPLAADIDIAALHQGFVRTMRAHGGEIRTSCTLVSGRRGPTGWVVDLGDGTTWEGDIVVDAAGAWGDIVAERCGIAPVGLTPMRRTAFMVTGPEGSEDWPLVIGCGTGSESTFYFKPDGPQLLCSLSEETPQQPQDARPEEIDVALAIERINATTTLGIRHVRSSWAGQRTFSPDRSMVIGPDPTEPTFVWLVGQGGTGIQSSPAAGRLAAATALGRELPADLAAAGVDPEALSPARFQDLSL